MPELTEGYYKGLHAGLVTDIEHKANVIRKLMKRSAETVLELGAVLKDVKDALPHGQFGKWVTDKLGVTQRTAQNYMQIAEAFGGKSEIISHLNPTAANVLASPSVPEEAREEAVARTEAGESLTVADAEEIVERKKETAASNGVVLDSLQKPVPDVLVPAFRLVSKYRGTVNDLGAALKRVDELHGDEACLRLDFQDVQRSIRQAQTTLKFAMPYAPCPVCMGEGCAGQETWCKGSGYIVRAQYRQLPSELKEKLEAAR